jgi:hypothetical protein
MRSCARRQPGKIGIFVIFGTPDYAGISVLASLAYLLAGLTEAAGRVELAASSFLHEYPTMKQHCYVIINNAGHSWQMLRKADATPPPEPAVPALPQLLLEGWLPVRETPMGGGTSALAHSLILLERADDQKPGTAKKKARG